jgi:hypothetical protein
MKLEVGKTYKDGKGQHHTIGGVVEADKSLVWSHSGNWFCATTGRWFSPFSDFTFQLVTGWRAICEEVDTKAPARDLRPRNRGWAPGEHLSKCCLCSELFLGDKRASECAPCAYDDEKRYES